jgi:hypothetical protein
VWITQYPDVSHSGNNSQLCDYTIVPNGNAELTSAEFDWANSNIVKPLLAAIADATTAHAWNMAPVYADFFNHGICASDHWVNTWLEDYLAQGDKFGFFHPNGKGQQDYANVFVPILRALPTSR